MKILVIAALSLVILSGCADIPIKDGELIINQTTSATVEDGGVARVNSRF